MLRDGRRLRMWHPIVNLNTFVASGRSYYTTDDNCAKRWRDHSPKPGAMLSIILMKEDGADWYRTQ
jgi:hypothetical protein